MPEIHDDTMIGPGVSDFETLIKAKMAFEPMQSTPERDEWNKKHFKSTPWGIAWKLSADPRAKVKSEHFATLTALKYFAAAVIIGWDDLVVQLKRTLKKWGYTKEDMLGFMKVWGDSFYAAVSIRAAEEALKNIEAETARAKSADTTVVEHFKLATALTEAVEKHNTLNSKLFTKEEALKDEVRDKMLEIVDEFLGNLKEQEIDIKVDDVIFIGSNASYNYTKDSDIDLHILTNTKSTKYSTEVAGAIYSAYRSLFNKNLDIEFFGIPVEIFVETEDSARVSNGIYSVKKNKWVKKPVQEEIPEYDTKALDKLVDEWEDKCKKLIADIKADKLENEDKVVKMLEDIYAKLRKKGISKGEYSVENLAFKELRNKGYLDQLKDFKHDLVSKRLSLEETFDRQTRLDIYNKLSRAAGTQPIIQDNGMFFIYNIKPSEINSRVQAIRKLPFVAEVHAYENGKYDFSNVLDLAMNKMPSKYYDIRGEINL